MSVLYFLLLLGALVTVHELGHFTAAKLLKFRVLRFSLGFGRPLVRFRGPETEYQIALVPIGGYVRILGEDASEVVDDRERSRSFRGRPLWQRLVVVFAGPAANLLLPILIYFAFFAGHDELPAAVVGDVVKNSPAARAGIEPGDRLLAVDGEPLRYWEDFESRVNDSAGSELKVRLRRGNQEIERFLLSVERTIRYRDGRSERRGWVGLSQAPFRTQIGIVDPSSPGGRAGLQTGDVIVAVDGKEVASWTGLQRVLSRSGRRTIAYFRGYRAPGIPGLKVFHTRIADMVPETRTDGAGRGRIETDIAPAQMLVAEVKPGSPADAAGLRTGDLITSLDGAAQSHWFLFDQTLQSKPARAWRVAWRRSTGPEGATEMEGVVRQRWEVVPDDYGHGVRRLLFGARNDVDSGVGEVVPVEGRVSYAASRAVVRTVDTVVEMASGFLSVLHGETPRETVGGPLMMFRVASVSGAQGIEAFLLLLALVSVNLGLINLLPVPMLDGGQLVVFAIEGIRRRPLSARARERIMVGGLVAVAAITVLALRNDLIWYLGQ